MSKQDKKRNAYIDEPPNKQIRELLGDSAERKAEFAEKLGISIEAIRLWASGYTRPDIAKLADIANFFDVTTDYLLGLNEIRNTEIEDIAIGKKLGLSDIAIKAMEESHIRNGHVAPNEQFRYDYSYSDIVNAILEDTLSEELFESLFRYFSYERIDIEKLKKGNLFGSNINFSGEIFKGGMKEKIGIDIRLSPEEIESTFLVSIQKVLRSLKNEIDKTNRFKKRED